MRSITLFQEIAVVLVLVTTGMDGQKPGFCGDCWCIPAPGEACPYELEPNMNFTSFLPSLLEFEWENPITLNCNPYLNETDCDLEPSPRTPGGACVIEFVSPGDGSTCPTNWKYSTRTFAGTLEEAQSQGLYVTHAGPCGACSSLQDLYVYKAQGEKVADEATQCGIRGFSSAGDGTACFRELGFTEGCAATWHYNTQTTQNFCIELCSDLFLQNKPNNGPPPECTLDPCIECDEIYAGPIFKEFAGRTRRSSGLLSGISRPCFELVPVPQIDPCAAFRPTPTESPISASLSLFSWKWNVILVAKWMVVLW
eukprot:scaffold425_cov175-Amphora_coffeaeformis.AAC.62